MHDRRWRPVWAVTRKSASERVRACPSALSEHPSNLLRAQGSDSISSVCLQTARALGRAPRLMSVALYRDSNRSLVCTTHPERRHLRNAQRSVQSHIPFRDARLVFFVCGLCATPLPHDGSICRLRSVSVPRQVKVGCLQSPSVHIRTMKSGYPSTYPYKHAVSRPLCDTIGKISNSVHGSALEPQCDDIFLRA